MSEKKYIVSDNNKVLASEMTIEDALLFVKAYFNEYYNERLSLTITDMSKAGDQLNE